MYEVQKTMTISAAHNLDLPYDSKCKLLHGHNFVVTVFCRSKELNPQGMVVDFNDIKKIVNEYDHTYLNHVLAHPTAENLARKIQESIDYCYKVEISETEGNKVVYQREDD